MGAKGKKHLPKSKPGDQFEYLTLVEKGPKGRRGYTTWFCKCKCGEPKLVLRSQEQLRSHPDTSCGCRKYSPIGEAGWNYLYNMHLRGCKRKNRIIVNELSIEQHNKIRSLGCYYCASAPVKTSRYKYNTNMSEFATKRAEIYVNGIDRLDNNLGYTLENCVPCCKICNNMKKDLTLSTFLAKIKQISCNLLPNSVVSCIGD